MPQALFAIGVRVHAVSKQTPFYLLYGVNPRLPGDDNHRRTVDAPVADVPDRIEKLHTVRWTANEPLMEKAIRAKKV